MCLCATCLCAIDTNDPHASNHDSEYVTFMHTNTLLNIAVWWIFLVSSPPDLHPLRACERVKWVTPTGVTQCCCVCVFGRAGVKVHLQRLFQQSDLQVLGRQWQRAERVVRERWRINATAIIELWKKSVIYWLCWCCYHCLSYFKTSYFTHISRHILYESHPFQSNHKITYKCITFLLLLLSSHSQNNDTFTINRKYTIYNYVHWLLIHSKLLPAVFTHGLTQTLNWFCTRELAR